MHVRCLGCTLLISSRKDVCGPRSLVQAVLVFTIAHVKYINLENQSFCFYVCNALQMHVRSFKESSQVF